MPVTPLAKLVRDALIASSDLKALVDQLYTELGAITVARVIDTGPAGEVLIALPGYSPLSDPTQYVFAGQAA